MAYLFVGVGGIIGSLLRYLVSILTEHFLGMGFPIGTLVINLSGAFFLGWFTITFVATRKLHPNIIAALSSGLTGSYTTFSTFSVETVRLINSGKILSALFYMAISIVGGLLFIRVGIKFAEQRMKKARQIT